MAGVTIDYSQILLQENIPFSKEELADFEKSMDINKKIPRYVSLLVLPLMAFIVWLIKDNLSKLKMVDFLLLAFATLLGYFFMYGIAKLLLMFDDNRLKKDLRIGKSKLQTFIINKDKTEYGEYITFAGRNEKEKIRLEVSQQDYKRLQTGTKVLVAFLKYRQQSITIEEI
jgi:hypothetical protein